MKAVERLRQEFGVKTEPDLVALFRLPGVVAAPGAAGELQSEEMQEKLGAQVEACLEQALNKLEAMRRSEGQALTAEMQGILGQIADRGRRKSRRLRSACVPPLRDAWPNGWKSF